MTAVARAEEFNREQIKALTSKAEAFEKGPIFSDRSVDILAGILKSLPMLFDSQVRKILNESGEFFPEVQSIPRKLNRLQYIENHPYLHKMTAFAKTALLIISITGTIFSYLYIPGKAVPIVGALLYTYGSYRCMVGSSSPKISPSLILKAVLGGGMIFPIIEKKIIRRQIQQEADSLNKNLSKVQQQVHTFIQSDPFQQLGAHLEAKIDEKQQAFNSTPEDEMRQRYTLDTQKTQYQNAHREWLRIQKAGQAGGIYANAPAIHEKATQ